VQQKKGTFRLQQGDNSI